ncbi:MAG: Kazal-type serine protease inhibitor domain-containing protein [Phyllobacterium sp.]
MIYAPVCGERAGRVRTFSNSCQARADGFRVVHNGQCRGSVSRPPRPGGPSAGRACTREFAPVCARRGNSVRTFSNACEARNRGYGVVRNRPC